MRKILFMLVACVLCACTGNNGGSSDKFALDILEYNASGLGDSFDIKVTSKSDWSASSDQSWATVTPNEGAGNATVKVETAPNSKETSDKATITFTPKSGTAVKFTVNREGNSSSFIVTPETKTFTSKGGYVNATVKAAGEWTVECAEDWITLSVTGGDGNGEMKISAVANETIAERQATVNFKNGEETDKIVITQVTDTKFAKTNMLFKFTGTWCQNCPEVSEALDLIAEEDPNSFVEIALHGDEKGDAVVLETPATAKYAEFLGLPGYPCVFADLNKDLFAGTTGDVEKTRTALENMMTQVTKTNPTVLGVKLSTELTSDKKIKVRVETTIQKSGPYKIICAHIKSGYNFTQINAEDTYHQNYVLHSFLQKDIFGDKLSENNCAAGDVIVTEYEVDAIDVEKIEQESIVIGILNRTAGGDYMVNNAAGCKVGESTDYRFL